MDPLVWLLMQTLHGSVWFVAEPALHLLWIKELSHHFGAFFADPLALEVFINLPEFSKFSLARFFSPVTLDVNYAPTSANLDFRSYEWQCKATSLACEMSTNTV